MPSRIHQEWPLRADLARRDRCHRKGDHGEDGTGDPLCPSGRSALCSAPDSGQCAMEVDTSNDDMLAATIDAIGDREQNEHNYDQEQMQNLQLTLSEHEFDYGINLE